MPFESLNLIILRHVPVILSFYFIPYIFVSYYTVSFFMFTRYCTGLSGYVAATAFAIIATAWCNRGSVLSAGWSTSPLCYDCVRLPGYQLAWSIDCQARTAWVVISFAGFDYFWLFSVGCSQRQNLLSKAL